MIAPHYLQGSRSDSSLTIGKSEWRAFVVSFVMLYVLFISMPLTGAVLIDSTQIESDEALDPNFRGMASDEIERFRQEIVKRTGDRLQGEVAFKLYDTYGFPLDLTEESLRARGVTVDTDGFSAANLRVAAISLPVPMQ